MLTLLLFPLVLGVSADECPAPVRISENIHQELVRSQLQFSIELLQTVGQMTSNNVFLSPSSVYKAMLVTYFSSGGHTDKSLKRALRIPDHQVKINVISDYLQSKYKSKEVNSNILVSSANRIYISNELQVKDCMKRLFYDELRPANFRGDAAGAIRDINSWVAEHTRNMIPNLLQKNSLGSDTKAAIVNAAYFKGNWQARFDQSRTRQDKFHKADGTTVPVTMMYLFIKPGNTYNRYLKATILELPYEGGDVSMFILLPEKPSGGAISSLLSKLTGQTLQDVFEEASYQAGRYDTDVFIPKFTVDLKYDLKKILSLMGADEIFKRSADFSTLLSNAGGVEISEAIHKAKIQVDEEGSEAAAATNIGIIPISATIRQNYLFRADHPFIYAIYDKSSKILWFTGIYNSP